MSRLTPPFKNKAEREQFKRRWGWTLRPLAASVFGNLCGWGAWRLGLWALPVMWAGQSPHSNVLVLLALTGLSAIVMAGPPVLVGALAGWLAGGRVQILVGLLSGLWSFQLITSVPAALPIAPGLWYASTVLVLFSGAMGGWTMSFGHRLSRLYSQLPVGAEREPGL